MQKLINIPKHQQEDHGTQLGGQKHNFDHYDVPEKTYRHTAPPFANLAAASFAYGWGKRSLSLPGRVYISPSSLGPSTTSISAAMAFTSSSVYATPTKSRKAIRKSKKLDTKETKSKEKAELLYLKVCRNSRSMIIRTENAFVRPRIVRTFQTMFSLVQLPDIHEYNVKSSVITTVH
nr:hypothetical protein Iba_chr01bCG0370 [Ipomoea batatas]GMC50820.1 hypothetical protein Iba_chr01cCG0440 [Ipomoea batatas]